MHSEHTSTLLIASSAAGGFAAVLVIAGAARARWRETFGRRRDRYARLSRLGTGAHLSFFQSVLGEPPAIRRSIVKKDYKEWVSPDDDDYDPTDREMQYRIRSRHFEVSIFIDRDYYVQAISDDDGSVLAFSVTTRSPRFKPLYIPHRKLGILERRRFRQEYGESYRPILRLRLGKTRFADLDSDDPGRFSPPHLRLTLGAHNYAYSEFTYLGNPGYYQSFVWTASDASRGAGEFGKTVGLYEELGEGHDEWPYPDDGPDEPSWSDMPRLQQFRHEALITTYTVIGVGLTLENYPLNRFGPWSDEVRTLP